MPRMTVLSLITDEVMPQLRGLEEKVDKLTERMDSGEKAINRIDARLDGLDLNGHKDALKALALAAPAIIASIPTPEEAQFRAQVVQHMGTMQRFVDVAPQLIATVDKAEQDAEGRAWLSGKLRLRARGKFILAAIGILSTLAWTVNAIIAVAHNFHFQGVP